MCITEISARWARMVVGRDQSTDESVGKGNDTLDGPYLHSLQSIRLASDHSSLVRIRHDPHPVVGYLLPLIPWSSIGSRVVHIIWIWSSFSSGDGME